MHLRRKSHGALLAFEAHTQNRDPGHNRSNRYTLIACVHASLGLRRHASRLFEIEGEIDLPSLKEASLAIVNVWN